MLVYQAQAPFTFQIILFNLNNGNSRDFPAGKSFPLLFIIISHSTSIDLTTSLVIDYRLTTIYLSKATHPLALVSKFVNCFLAAVPSSTASSFPSLPNSQSDVNWTLAWHTMCIALCQVHFCILTVRRAALHSSSPSIHIHPLRPLIWEASQPVS